MTTPTNRLEATALYLDGFTKFVNGAVQVSAILLPDAGLDGAADKIDEAKEIMSRVLGIPLAAFHQVAAPLPQTGDEIIAALRVGGPDYIKPAQQWFDANLDERSEVLHAHQLLNDAGYALQVAWHQPEGAFGAGGSDKGGGGGGH